MNELNKKFQELGWRDTTEAYYGLDFTPFMNVVEEVIAEIKATNECPDCSGEKYVSYSCCTGEIVNDDLLMCPICREHLGEEICQTCDGTGIENPKP